MSKRSAQRVFRSLTGFVAVGVVDSNKICEEHASSPGPTTGPEGFGMRKFAWAALLAIVTACGATASTAPSVAPATSATASVAGTPAAPGKAELTKIVVAKSGTDDFTSVNQNYFL